MVKATWENMPRKGIAGEGERWELKMKPSPLKVESQPIVTKLDNSSNSHKSMEFKKRVDNKTRRAFKKLHLGNKMGTGQCGGTYCFLLTSRGLTLNYRRIVYITY